MSTETVFKFVVCAFGFIIGSCLFKTFFSAFFSVLTFLFSIYFCIRDKSLGNQPFFCKLGLLLFAYIALSITWSDSTFLESLAFLSEYRSFLLIPLVAYSFYLCRVQASLLLYFCLGCLVALFASYGLALGILEIHGAELSLANRIFHGFLMSIFCFGLITTAVHTESTRLRIISYFFVAIVLFNVLNIETGRTGYIVITTLSILALILANPPKRALLYCTCLLAGIVLAFYNLESFGDRVTYTLSNVHEIVFGDSQSVLNTSAGTRVEFYSKALQFGIENPVFGVGVGDVESLFANKYQIGEIAILTDNVHSEYLNMLLIGGFPLLFLYCAYLTSIFWYGYKLVSFAKPVGWMFMAVSLWLGTASTFNSSIKDFGDKQLVILVLSWLIACVLSIEKNKNPLEALFKFNKWGNK